MSARWAAFLCADIRPLPRRGCQVLTAHCSPSIASRRGAACVSSETATSYSSSCCQRPQQQGQRKANIGSTGGRLSASASFHLCLHHPKSCGNVQAGNLHCSVHCCPREGKINSTLWFQLKIRTGVHSVCIHLNKQNHLAALSCTQQQHRRLGHLYRGNAAGRSVPWLRGPRPARPLRGSSVLIPPRKIRSLQQNTPTPLPASPEQLM